MCRLHKTICKGLFRRGDDTKMGLKNESTDGRLDRRACNKQECLLQNMIRLGARIQRIHVEVSIGY